MSIVGTRPPLISETNLYEPRHKVSLWAASSCVLRRQRRADGEGAGRSWD